MIVSPETSASQITTDTLRLLRQQIAAPQISALPLATKLPPHDKTRPCALVFSPHPDDECLTGILPLRLLRERNFQIIVVAMTLGSDKSRRAARNIELAKACAVLGFAGFLPEEYGFSNINVAVREEEGVAWRKKVFRLAEIIAHYMPQALFMPHVGDWNATHVGAHLLARDALVKMPGEFNCTIIETEYWQPMLEPNLMVGAGEQDAATLLSALACHAGEVARNPYDRRFLAYLIDNVRRGSERVGGKGAVSAPMDFAMLYKIGLWSRGKFMPSALNRMIGANESVGALFD